MEGSQSHRRSQNRGNIDGSGMKMGMNNHTMGGGTPSIMTPPMPSNSSSDMGGGLGRGMQQQPHGHHILGGDIEGGTGSSMGMHQMYNEKRNKKFGRGGGLYNPNVNLPFYPVVGGIIGVTLFLMLIFWSMSHVVLVLGITAYGFFYAFSLQKWLLDQDDGTREMREVSEPIRQGSVGFLRVQYNAIFKLACFVTAAIFLSYQFRSSPDHTNLATEKMNPLEAEANNAVPSSGGAIGESLDNISNFWLGLFGAFTFICGAFCSGICGYVNMWVASRSNIRVASACRQDYWKGFVLCLKSGAFSSILTLSLCIGGVTALNIFTYVVLVLPGTITVGDVPMINVGYGFGASFVALFMQLGGGIYTKAADVGADLVGKVEVGIPEDDPRNPAVIADLVGDMVGDCVGSSADVFESIAAEIIAAMVLGGVLAKQAGIETVSSFVFFPMVVHGFDVVVSSISLNFVCLGGLGGKNKKGSTEHTDPMIPMMRGYALSCLMASCCMLFTTRWLLYVPHAPSAWINYFFAGCTGIATSFVFLRASQYYTDYNFAPVRAIAKACTTGHATNIIVGVAVGLQSCVVPVLAVSFTVLTSYHLGRSSGIVPLTLANGNTNREHTLHNAGLFGTAVATMGMLSSAAYVLAMNNYGPIADNAGGIVEMSNQNEIVRIRTDMLDASGNVTKAMTKGFSVGSAAMATFLLFGAYLDEFSAYSGREFHDVNLATTEVLIGGLLGVMLIFLFAGLSIMAVGNTAQEVVKEVRRQFASDPGIMQGTSRPHYQKCVSLVTEAALREMRFPGLLAVAAPVSVGLLFRFIGECTNRPLLGAESLAGFLLFATVAGILLALFLDNVGGAWDNAKKYIEMGNHGGKGGDAHKAAVTGDTVGDPFKDTAGPALHVVIKLLSTTILVLLPLFVSKK
eukprot:g3661.t1